MRARPFQGEVVEGCVVRVSDGLRPRASALVHALVEQMKAHGHEAVAYNKGRYKGRCRFRFGEILCEVYVQENVSNDGIPGTIGRMKPRGTLYMGVRIAKRLHNYWFEPDGKKLEDMLDGFIIKLEHDVQPRHGATANPDEPIENLKLPSRALTCLHRAGIVSISQLASKAYRDLWQMPNCGQNTVRDIDSALKARGIILKGEYFDLG